MSYVHLSLRFENLKFKFECSLLTMVSWSNASGFAPQLSTTPIIVGLISTKVGTIPTIPNKVEPFLS